MDTNIPDEVKMAVHAGYALRSAWASMTPKEKMKLLQKMNAPQSIPVEFQINGSAKHLPDFLAGSTSFD